MKQSRLDKCGWPDTMKVVQELWENEDNNGLSRWPLLATIMLDMCFQLFRDRGGIGMKWIVAPADMRDQPISVGTLLPLDDPRHQSHHVPICMMAGKRIESGDNACSKRKLDKFECKFSQWCVLLCSLWHWLAKWCGAKRQRAGGWGLHCIFCQLKRQLNFTGN